MSVLKIIEVIWSIDREILAFCTHWFADHACDRNYAHCVNREHLLLFERNFTDCHNVQKHSSPCAVSKIALWKLIGRWVIRNLGHLHISLIWLTNRYPFDADREVVRYLAGVKHLTRSRTCHLFFETYHFCWWAGESFQSVLFSQTSLTQREIS
jgi:hypothetical protein